MEATVRDSFRVARQAVFLGLQETWDLLEENVQQEIAKKESGYKERLDDCQSHATAKQQHLENENEALKQQVSSLRNSLENENEALKQQVSSLRNTLEQAQKTQKVASADETHANARSSNGESLTIPAGADAQEHTNDSEKHDPDMVKELQHGLNKYRSRYEAIKEQFDLAVGVARKRKMETLNWVKYADSLELKIKRLEKKRTGRSSAQAVATASTAENPTAATSGSTSHLPLTPATLERAPPPNKTTGTLHDDTSREAEEGAEARPDLSASFSNLVSSSFVGITGGDIDRAEGTGQEVELPARDGLQLPNTQHENPDADNETAIESTQGEPSSDEAQPQLPTLPAPSIRESIGERNNAKIKKEPSSDGPEIVWERPVKKRRREVQKDQQPQTPGFNVAVKEEKSDLAQSLSGFIGSQDNMDLDEGQLAMPTPRKRHLVYQQDSSQSNGGESTNEDIAQYDARIPNQQRDDSPLAALTLVSVNIRREARDSARRQKDPVKYMKQLKRGVESLAEDNEGHPSLGGARQHVLPPGSAKSTRLQALLNSRPPEPSPISSASRAAVHRSSTDSPISGDFGQPPPKRILPQRREGGPASATDKGVSKASATTPRAPPSSRTTTPLLEALRTAAADSAKKKGALRWRPVGQLRMDDFKINPAYNGGETFAYSEVVRRRTDRGNLAGCTDPQCCGKAFRAMAESELSAAGSSHIGRPDSVAMLERYLGDEAFVLARMSPTEKKELWLEAKTKELADKFGKHRHRYHRRASPPGFWDTDFPTTQEEGRHRAAAEQIEKTAVQERHREAMKPGGRWLFRDE